MDCKCKYNCNLNAGLLLSSSHILIWQYIAILGSANEPPQDSNPVTWASPFFSENNPYLELKLCFYYVFFSAVTLACSISLGKTAFQLFPTAKKLHSLLCGTIGKLLLLASIAILQQTEHKQKKLRLFMEPINSLSFLRQV